MHWKVLLILFFSVIVYLLLGAVGFHYIEGPTEKSLHTDVQTAAREFLSQFNCVDTRNMSLFLEKILDAYKSGYRFGENGTIVAPPPKWDYASALFFCMTVITTIGYGNLSPSTRGGQAFCCIYALIGIPLLAIMLSGLAERVKSVKNSVQGCRCWRSKGRVPEIVTNMLYFFLGVLLFVFVPAWIFVAIEGWSYGIGLYYSFITLTTIGFGDYVAGQTVSSIIYKLFLSVWIYLGLVFMSGVISTVQGFMEEGTKNAESKVTAAENVAEDNGEAAASDEKELKGQSAETDSVKLEASSL